MNLLSVFSQVHLSLLTSSQVLGFWGSHWCGNPSRRAWCLLHIFPSCSNSCAHFLLHWFNERRDVWREKPHFAIGRKISNEKRMCGNIISSRQNLESYVILQTVILHFADIIIWGQVGHLERNESPWLIALVFSWQWVLATQPKGLEVLTKSFELQPATLPSCLETWHWLDSWWVKFLQPYIYRTEKFHPCVRFVLASNFPPRELGSRV